MGLLGHGRIAGLFHLGILAHMRGVEVRAVADSDPDRRVSAGAVVHEAAVVNDYQEVLRNNAIDAVVICLPTGVHAEAACAAFQAGKNVYLEKPIATSREDGREVVQAWRSSGAVGMMGFNQRFDPVFRALKRAVDQGRVGRVVSATAVMGSAARTLPAWKGSRSAGGGALLDLASHSVDLTRFLFGLEIRSVSAAITSARTEEDTASLSMTLTDGRIIDAHATLAGVQESRFEVLGDSGRLVADRYAETLTFQHPSPPYGRVERLRRELARLGAIPRGVRDVVRPPNDARSYRAALEAFIGAVSGGKSVRPDIEDGFRSLTVVLAAEESDRKGQRIELEVSKD